MSRHKGSEGSVRLTPGRVGDVAAAAAQPARPALTADGQAERPGASGTGRHHGLRRSPEELGPCGTLPTRQRSCCGMQTTRR